MRDAWKDTCTDTLGTKGRQKRMDVEQQLAANQQEETAGQQQLQRRRKVGAAVRVPDKQQRNEEGC